MNEIQEIINLTKKLKTKLQQDQVIKDIVKSDSALYEELKVLHEEIENLLSLGI